MRPNRGEEPPAAAFVQDGQAKSRKNSRERRLRLSPAEVALIERLVASEALVAVPQIGSARPRRVVSAALDPAGDRLLLYLSAKPAELDLSAKPAELVPQQRSARRLKSGGAAD
jgi:hypothetical protein